MWNYFFPGKISLLEIKKQNKLVKKIMSDFWS